MDQFLSSDFWQTLYSSFLKWVITDSPPVLILIILVFVALKLVKLVTKRLKILILKRHTDEEGIIDLEAQKRVVTLMDIMNGLLVVVIWAMFIMIFLNKVGINIAPILASAGIIGLAVGFGAQELVRDFISGFFMLLEDQIRIGDVAVINGTGGLVEKMELRTITLRDFSGVVHVFQNGKVDTLSNRTKGWSAMVFDIGVAYKENVDNVIELIKEVGADLQKDPEFSDRILEPIEVFGLDEFADSALVIKARFKTKPSEQWFTGREFRKRLKASFDKNNIEIPFPHTTVYWGEEISPLQLKIEDGNLPIKKN